MEFSHEGSPTGLGRQDCGPPLHYDEELGLVNIGHDMWALLRRMVPGLSGERHPKSEELGVREGPPTRPITGPHGLTGKEEQA